MTCENEGICTDMLNNFTCDCHPGFRGERCEENIDECKPQPCKNGGTCVDGVAGYNCLCTKEWTGKLFTQWYLFLADDGLSLADDAGALSLPDNW